jgi:ATP-binding cassette subfamily F protein uup
VSLARLTQSLDALDPQGRVLATVESVRRVARTESGEITATAMLERFGFTGDKLTARIGDLSGGERRRFQLLCLLLGEPNLLLLDEPTNDLDIETLNVVEDFLDRWPGTLVVVSHDRYFLERTTDVIYGLLDDGRLSLLPGGVDDYLSRRSGTSPPSRGELSARESGEVPLRPRRTPTSAGSAQERTARKTLARVERRLEQVARRESELNDAVVASASEHERLVELSAQLAALSAEREALEAEWLEAAELIE